MRDQFAFSLGRLTVFLSFTGRYSRIPADFEVKPIREGFILDGGLGRFFCLLTTITTNHKDETKGVGKQ